MEEIRDSIGNIVTKGDLISYMYEGNESYGRVFKVCSNSVWVKDKLFGKLHIYIFVKEVYQGEE